MTNNNTSARLLEAVAESSTQVASSLTSLRSQVNRLRRNTAKLAAENADLKRYISANDASVDLETRNKRLTCDIDYASLIIGLYRSGETEAANRLTDLAFPRAVVRVKGHDGTRPVAPLVQYITDGVNKRHGYIYDAHGHYVRADLVDTNRECHRCRKENRRNRIGSE